MGIPNHLSWITFVRNLYKCNKHPRVLMYINARLIFLNFSFRKEIYNHKDINLVSFTNSSSILDIYPDNHQLALKYLKDTEADLNNVIIMSSDFNIRNSDWNPSFPHHLMHADHLLEIADLLNLERLLSINLVPNRYTDNPNNSNSVIVLIFLRGYSEEFNTHLILPDMRGLFDYSPLIINIVIQEELIQWKRLSLHKGDKKKKDFIKQLRASLGGISTLAIENGQLLERVVGTFAHSIKTIWSKHAKWVRITRQSKDW